MIIGYLLVIGGVAQLAAGWRSGLIVITSVGALWCVAGLGNIALSSHHRRGATMVRSDDMANPAARAKLYQGVTGQLTRGLIALACAIVALAVAIFYPFALTDIGWRLLPLICAAIIGPIILLGLLLYALTSTERAAVLPATVVVQGFKQTPLRGAAGQPYVTLVLDVYPEGGNRYESTVQTVVPALAIPRLAVGSQFRAQVAGPEKPANVIIDFSSAIQAGVVPAERQDGFFVSPTSAPRTAPAAAPDAEGSTASARLRELGELRSQGLVTESEYDEQRGRILDEI